jgi:endoglucanase
VKARFALPLAALALIGATDAPGPHLNQIGFRPDTAKRAILAHDGTTPLPWRLIDESGRTVAEGKSLPFSADAASGDKVHQIDFSRFATPGTYRLQVDGQTSHPFTIAANVYRPLARASLNFFYQNRLAGLSLYARRHRRMV